MNPINFPETNAEFGAPKGLSPEQVGAVQAYCGRVVGGSLDGARLVVTAWQPTLDEIELIRHRDDQ